MGRREGLVQIQVHAVKAHVAGAGMAHDGVQVGAVVVAQAAGLVDDAGNLQNVRVKQAQGVGVCQHQAGGVGAGGRPQRVQIHTAPGVGGHCHHSEPRHGGRRRVGAVGRVRHKDLGAGGVPAGLVVPADQQKAGVLAVGAGGGLHGHAGHAGDLAQQLFRTVQHLQSALGGPGGLQRVQFGKAGQGGQRLVDAGVILHGAGTQRVEPVVDAVGLPGQFDIMAVQVHLRKLRQPRRRGAQGFRRKVRRRGVAGGQVFHAPAGAGTLKQQFHLAAPPGWQRSTHRSAVCG